MSLRITNLPKRAIQDQVKIWQAVALTAALWWAVPRYRVRLITLLLVVYLVGIG